MENEIISLREFARRMNVGEKTIRDGVKLGKISKGVTYVNERPKIIFEIASLEFKEINLGAQVLGERDYEDATPQELINKGIAGLGGDTSLATATRAEKIFKAQREYLKVQKEEGKLVEKEEVYRALFQEATIIKSALLSIPDKVIDDIISLAGDRNAAHKLLYETIIDELTALSDLKEKDFLKPKDE